MKSIICTIIVAVAFGHAFATSSLSSVDYASPQPPNVNDNTLHILTPSLLELKLINTKAADPASPTIWNFVKNGRFLSPSTRWFAVTANGKSINVSSVYFKRRPFYGPASNRDLRIENSLYLLLASPVSDNQSVQVKNPNGQLWPASMQFTNVVDPLRYSPAIHVTDGATSGTCRPKWSTSTRPAVSGRSVFSRPRPRI
jgi:hypothetical protein